MTMQRSLAFLLVAVCAFLGTRFAARSSAGTTEIATGLSLPALLPELGEIISPIPESGCILVVFFSATCPHCQNAARAQALEGLPMSTLWVGQEPADWGFAEKIHNEAALLIAPALLGVFRVVGVPAAFLVEDRVVKEA